MTYKTKEALVHYEAALKEAFPSGATGDVFHHWNEARKALAEESSGAEQPAQPQTDQSVTPEYLEWLDSIQPRHGVGGNEAWNAGVAWAKAQPQQEPVAVALQFRSDDRLCLSTVFDTMAEAQKYANECSSKPIAVPLYTSPPASKPWVGLTEKEKREARNSVSYSPLAMTMGEWTEAVQDATEAKLREKNA